MQIPSSLRLRIGPSRGLAAVLLVIHGAAVAIPWSVGMPALLATAMSAVVAGWGVVQIRRHAARRSPDSVVEIVLEDNGAVRLQARAGGTTAGRVVEARCLGPWLVFLRIELDDTSTVAVALARDACVRDDFRRLRVRVRWMPSSVPSGAPQSDPGGQR